MKGNASRKNEGEFRVILQIKDDFDIEKIVNSGQCFRPRMLSDGSFLFVTGRDFLKIKEVGHNSFGVSVDLDTWKRIWFDYFDMVSEYCHVRESVSKDDEFMQTCARESQGIRILRQNKWEMLISYIISQRKSIPAIRTAVEKLCVLYGDKIGEVDGEVIYSFPEPEQMMNATKKELDSCGLGYRTEYILNAIDYVNKNKAEWDSIESLGDEELFDYLKKFKGVGDKVANCVMLFAYHRISRAPVDTWIKKVMDEKYGGENPFIKYGENAGIIQQYVFHYVQNKKGL